MQDIFEPTPDAKPPRRQRESTFRFIVGIILVILGIGIFLEQISGLDLGFVPLLVGAGLLAGWSQNRSRALLVAGCIVSGFGFGSVFAPLVIHDLQRAVELLSLAGGFALISILSRRKPTWPWIVAGALSLVAVADVADVSQFVPLSVVRFGLPSVVVLAGVVLLMRDRVSRRSQFVMLAVLAISGLILNGARDRTSVLVPTTDESGRTITRVEAIPEGTSRVIVVADEALVTVKEGKPSVRLVSTAQLITKDKAFRLQERLEVKQDQDSTVIKLGDARVGHRLLTIWVRDGTSVQIAGDSRAVVIAGPDLGTVDVTSRDGSVTVDSVADQVDIKTRSGEVKLRPSSGSAITVATNSGDVELLMSSSSKMRTLLVSESGNVLTPDGRYQPMYSAEGDDGSIEVTSKFGDITLTAIPTL